MTERQLLIIPAPTLVNRDRRATFPRAKQVASLDEQLQRITPRFERLQRIFEAGRISFQTHAHGALPEQVLVIETAGSIADFANAVRRVPGMEWLAEWEHDDLPSDEYTDDVGKLEFDDAGGRLMLVMTDQQAIIELLSLWERFKNDPETKLEYGRARWKEVFRQLRDIRFWGAQDRIRETGIIEDWMERVRQGRERARFEAELWYRRESGQRRSARQGFEEYLAAEGGRVIREVLIPQIAYHGILAELPVGAVDQLARDVRGINLVQCNEVMFLRPVGQFAVRVADEGPLEDVVPPEVPLPQGDPVAAVFDGLPLENHRWLAGRLIVDDPEDWGRTYPAHQRLHGTAMASLVIHGDIDAGEAPLRSPVYARPVLRPEVGELSSGIELMPEEELPVDLLHRAVQRLFSDANGAPASAPTVRVINFSIADASRLFDRSMSSLARLVDWLSWQHRLLFVVSAGNHPQEVVLGIPRQELGDLEPAELETAVLASMADDARHRRLRVPAEAMNALTVGAAHQDASALHDSVARRFDPLRTPDLPSPINPIGLGFRRAIKPEVLVPGGRQLYREKLGTVHSHATLSLDSSLRAPGQRAASPGAVSGRIDATRHYRGTSNAAALTTRTAVRLHEMLQVLRSQPGGGVLGEQYTAVLLKTLLVHGAQWGDAYKALAPLLEVSKRPRKETAARFLGYGVVQPQRVLSCTDQRATLLGCGLLMADGAHVFSVPLPPSLSGQATWRRLTLTLGWLTPINPTHSAYRRAVLWFQPPTRELLVHRREADWQAVQRGTIQHEVLTGDKATAFTDGTQIRVQVNCREEAGGVADQLIPYAVAVTLEVSEALDIPIYEEIRTRVRPSIRVQPERV